MVERKKDVYLIFFVGYNRVAIKPWTYIDTYIHAYMPALIHTHSHEHTLGPLYESHRS